MKVTRSDWDEVSGLTAVEPKQQACWMETELEASEAVKEPAVAEEPTALVACEGVRMSG